jgi:citrate lyase subunit beta/citryl-CoA lyase
VNAAPFDPSFLLFVPADRPDRFGKALASAASGIILDLEDAVAIDAKAVAREHVRAFLSAAADVSRVVVRINAPSTDDGLRDLEMLAGASRFAACMVPKAEGATELGATAAIVRGVPLIALIETARGVARCESIAETPGVIALAFGPYDLAADLGSDASSDVMLPHRARVLIAARASKRAAIDGPSREYGDGAIVARDAEAARRLGFDGKLLIHLAQIEAVRAAFAPSPEEIAYARRVVDAARRSSPAVLEGTMIDAPIVMAADRTLRRAAPQV